LGEGARDHGPLAPPLKAPPPTPKGGGKRPLRIVIHSDFSTVPPKGVRGLIKKFDSFMTIHVGATAGLYVHVPFCRGKCPYCDFASGTDLSLVADWLRALKQEMGFYRDFASRFDTLYLGGGTPSLLNADELAVLLESLREQFEFSPDTEITLEANPDDLNPPILKGYRELGINRLSLGVQSFADRELAFLGRRHDAAQALNALGWAREAGFANLGMDLMYGLPGQTVEQWQGSLETALGFLPEHLSCYQLTVEAGTPLARRQADARVQPLPEEMEREFFLFTSRFLEDQGYFHYEISNFARGGGNLSRHNRKYWNHTPYLGLGPAAHSYRGGRRWWNHRSLEAYCRALSAGEAPVAGEEVLTPEQARLEALYLGLRTRDGVSLSLLPEAPGRSTVVQKIIELGLAEMKEERLIPTREGLVVADRLALGIMD
jgi:putative oxygen-independent coproporphyrinogen III oxidase